jgi:hypothetical protein
LRSSRSRSAIHSSSTAATVEGISGVGFWTIAGAIRTREMDRR